MPPEKDSAQKLREWLDSPEGKKRLAELAQKNKETAERLQKAAYVSDELLKKRVSDFGRKPK